MSEPSKSHRFKNLSAMELEIYCTACSTQSGKNKKSVKHAIVVERENIKATQKKLADGTTKPAGGYRAEVICPVQNKPISTFLNKSKTLEFIQQQESQDGPTNLED